MADPAKRIDKPSLQEAAFNWEDPLDLESQLTEDERMIRDSARAFAAGQADAARQAGVSRGELRSARS